MRFTAAGDTAIQRVLTEYDGIDTIRDFINRGDARFFNLETTVNKDCYANCFSGGTWLRTDRKVLESTKLFNFNMTTFANNHCMDYGHEGLLQTVKNIDEAGYVHAGCGKNLREAASPRYLDLPQGRVALIACTTSFTPDGLAGEQSRLLPGRPGVNGLRVTQTLVVDEDDIAVLKKIADKTGVNIEKESLIRSGYSRPFPDGEYNLGDMSFKVGDKPGLQFEINKTDMSRIEKAIEEAAFFSDYVLVSFHSHDRQFEENHKPAKYIEDFAHRCIDCGAHAIIGHGPHLLRPFEVYKNRPIFYSLGDFMLQLENCELAPEDFYAKFNLTSDSSMYELFKARTRDFTCGLQRQQVMMESVISFFEMEEG
ncbi:MAG: CapA family protein, partial [Clostridia bacterium]|nr:CapA family protein [Clostridia bacterium]